MKQRCSLLALAFMLLVLLACGMSTGTLEGQVFIVTQGRENVKLALVEVHAFEEGAMKAYLKQRVEGFNAEEGRLAQEMNKCTKKMTSPSDCDEIRHKAERFMTPAYYFDAMPQPMLTAKTDADGHFSVSMKRGQRILLAACSSRKVFDHDETYYWIVSASLGGEAKESICLSNDNLLSSDPVICGYQIQNIYSSTKKK